MKRCSPDHITPLRHNPRKNQRPIFRSPRIDTKQPHKIACSASQERVCLASRHYSRSGSLSHRRPPVLFSTQYYRFAWFPGLPHVSSLCPLCRPRSGCRWFSLRLHSIIFRVRLKTTMLRTMRMSHHHLPKHRRLLQVPLRRRCPLLAAALRRRCCSIAVPVTAAARCLPLPFVAYARACACNCCSRVQAPPRSEHQTHQ